MRVGIGQTRLPALFLVLCSLCPTAASRGDEPPRPPGGEARLESGRVVDYTIHFDRNSLRDSLRLGDGLIALTSSGTLLRFSLPEVRLLAERIGVEEVTELGRGEGDVVLAGLSDGRVCRVDPATLALTDIVKLSGTPQWVGWVKATESRPAGVVAVMRQTRPMERNGERWDQPYWQGVYGFIELKDGQVWAFGGTSHMGYNTGCIWRIDGAEPRQLVKFDPPPGLQQEPDPSRPGLPITHVVEAEGGLLVLSYSDVFRVDTALRSWKKVATLDISYRWGRPNAVGAFLSVCALHPPQRDGEPYVLATVGDGYVLLEGAKATSHALPGQLGAAGIDRVLNTAEGTLFLQGDDDGVWRLGKKGREVASLAPPLEPDPANDFGDYEKKQGWSSTRVLAGPKGEIYTVSDSNVSAGTRTTARRVGGKPERIGRETSSLSASASFVTADGTLWNTDSRDLKRFEQGAWQTVARLPRRAAYARLKAINTNGPPWVLFAPSSFPEPEHPAAVLVRDARGRLWLGGEHGLALSERGAKAAEVFDRVPWIGRSEISDLAPDPAHDDGVIVALDTRGVAFVRARQEP